MKTCPHCGCVLVKGRSLSDHRRFFAMIHAAFHNWPESHHFQPDNAEHLRAWLTVKAGYRDATQIHLPDGATDDMRRLFLYSVEGAIRASGGMGFVVPYRDCVAVLTPRSIAWDKLDQKEFGKLRDAISDVIEAQTHIKIEDLMRDKAA